MEIRNRDRYRLVVDTVFTWQGPDRTRMAGEGVTHDFGLGGAFVETSTCPPVGATVHMDLFLPSELLNLEGKFRIALDSTVTRVEDSKLRRGFAVVIRDFKLLEDSEVRGVDSIPTGSSYYQ